MRPQAGSIVASPTFTGTLQVNDSSGNIGFSATEAGVVTVATSITYGKTSLRDVKLSPLNTADNAAYLVMYPASSTNAAPGLLISPKGTGYSSTLQSRLGLFNTDLVANGTNYELFGLWAYGTNGYAITSSKGGTGTVRPIWIDATGALTQAAANVVFNIDGTTTFKALNGTSFTAGTVPGTGTGAIYGSVFDVQTTRAFPGAITDRGILYYSSTNGLVIYGAGSTYDMLFLNKAGWNDTRYAYGNNRSMAKRSRYRLHVTHQKNGDRYYAVP